MPNWATLWATLSLLPHMAAMPLCLALFSCHGGSLSQRISSVINTTKLIATFILIIKTVQINEINFNQLLSSVEIGFL